MFIRMLFILALLTSVVLAQAAIPPEELETITPAQRALAARAEAVIATVGRGDSPGREFANQLRGEPFATAIRQMKGELPARKGSLNWVMTDLTRIVAMAEQGPTWPRPPLARVPRALTPPTIDGKLDDPAWAYALTYTGSYPLNTRTWTDTPKTTWKLLWDEQYLYFAFDCEDHNLIAPIVPRDSAIYTDDCVEIFLMPEMRFRSYWEVIINPAGSIFDGLQCKNIDRWGLTSDTSQDLHGMKVGVTYRGTLNHPGDTDQGYTVEVAIPFNELPEYSRAKPAVGQHLRFMLTHLDRDGDHQATYAYQPLMAWGHNIWNHAEMELVDGPRPMIRRR